MADVITRFKLETTQYDSKLRDASKGLADITKQASLAGNEFAKFTQKNVEAARAFGNIATSATNSKDKVKELVGAFNDVAKAYNNLTKEQQQSDFGKALAESMNTLKGRIADAKAEMNSTGGVLSQLKDKLTINIDALKLFNAGLSAAKAALDVAKDAFFASEASVDEWGRVVKSAEGLYEGFLNALNTGDISGYLDRMNEIVQAAREAYDAIDTLQTMKTIQAPQFSKQEAENNRMRAMLQTGRWISAGDGRKSPNGLKDGNLLSPGQIKAIERQLQNGIQTIVSLTKTELKQNGVAIDKYYNSLAKQNGISLSDFRKGTSSWNEFSKRIEGAQRYNAFERAHTTYDPVSGIGHRDKAVNPDAQYRGWDVFRVDKMGKNSYNDLVNLIKQQQQQQSQMYSTMGQAYRTINRAEGITVKGIMGGGYGGGKSGIDISDRILNSFEASMTKAGQDVEKMKPSDYIESPSVWEQYAKDIAKSMEEIDHSMDNLSFDNFTESYESVEKRIKEMTKAIKQQQMAFNMAGQAAQNFGAALQGIDDPAAKAAGTVMQAVASIALGFSMASSNANTAGTGWGWLAWLAAGTAAMATTISTIHSLTGYAEGGEIKGNSYSGDRIPIMANAGEIVLNKAQQSTLAQNLQGSGGGGFQLVGRLAGEDIIISAERAGKRMGYGQLMFWKGN